jgi:hypothetical protein
MDGFVKRVLTRPRLKQVSGKHLTGAMLLGLAIEYIEAMNDGSVPSIVDTFEIVAHAEAQKFSDELYEKTILELNERLS